MKLSIEDIQNLYTLITSNRLTIGANEAPALTELQNRLKAILEYKGGDPESTPKAKKG